MKKLIVSATLAFVIFVVSGGALYAYEGHGDGHHGRVSSSYYCKNISKQKNYTNIVNDVVVYGNTGGNKANANTYGDVTVTTGDVLQTVDVTNNAGVNVLEVSDYCCECGQVNYEINNNNSVKNKKRTTKIVRKVTQKNVTTIDNTVQMVGDTGQNSANKNTKTNVDLSTGSVSGEVTITNNGGVNMNGGSI